MSNNVFAAVFNDTANESYRIAHEHGFEESWEKFGEKVALMHAELSEALEGYRKNVEKSDHIPEFTPVEEEFADVIIRIMSFSAANKLRIGEAIVEKQKFNASRPYKHGGKKF